MLLIFIIGLHFSISWSGKAQIFPLLVSSLGTMLSFCLFISEKSNLESSVKRKKEKSRSQETKLIIKLNNQNVTFQDELLIIFWILCFISLTITFGFWIAMILFFPSFLLYFGQENVKYSILFTSSIWILTYFVFHIILKIPLYGGVFGLTW